MRLKNIVRALRDKIKGSINVAISQGMIVGNNIRIMGGVNFGSEPYLIEIGNDVTISFNVTFINHDGGTWAFRDIDEYNDVIKYGRIRVGDRSFIGCNATILPGVTIGSRCVIGAGSVVTKDVPDGMVVAGNPARIITSTDEYARKSKEKMISVDIKQYEIDKKKYLKKHLK